MSGFFESFNSSYYIGKVSSGPSGGGEGFEGYRLLKFPKLGL